MRSNNDIKRIGGFISLGGLILLALAIGGIGIFIDKFSYSLNDDPIMITSPGQLDDLKDGDYVELSGKLDYELGILADKLAGDPYLLAPLEGTDLRIWISMKGGGVPSARNDVTVRGRVSGKSGSEWTIGDGRDFDLAYQVKKLLGLRISDSTLVVRDGETPGDGMGFAYLAGGISLLILGSYVVRLFSWIGALADSAPSRQTGGTLGVAPE